MPKAAMVCSEQLCSNGNLPPWASRHMRTRAKGQLQKRSLYANAAPPATCPLPPLEFTCWRKPTLSYGIIYNSSKHYLIWGGEQEKNAFAQREMNYKSHHFEDAAQVKPTLAFCSSLTALPSDREFSVCFQYQCQAHWPGFTGNMHNRHHD